MRIQNGVASVRAGATLLFDSVPAAEEAETRLKASALLRALELPASAVLAPENKPVPRPARIKVLMVDHQDSFVHTLSAYLQEAGADVVTVRHDGVARMLAEQVPQLVVLSPGPGRPDEFRLRATLDLCLARKVPVFGVCLGLQGIVEYFGGALRRLDYPMHGKQSQLAEAEGGLFDGLPRPICVGRYHSLVAATVPDCLEVCARSVEGDVMAVVHKTLPLAAVQFHPESILTLEGDKGRALIRNALRYLVG
jgi:anthranilate synthase